MNSGNPCSVHVQGEEGSTPGSGHGSHAAHYRHPADPPHMSHGRCNCGARGQYSGVRAYFKDEGHAMLRRHSSPDGCCAMRSGDCSVMHAAPRPLTRHRHHTHAGDRFVMDRHAPHAPPLPLAFYDQIENVDMNAREFHEMEARDLCGCADCTRVSVRSHRPQCGGAVRCAAERDNRTRPVPFEPAPPGSVPHPHALRAYEFHWPPAALLRRACTFDHAPRT
eukprot:635924_1